MTTGTPVPSRGSQPLHVVQLLGAGGAGTGVHVRSLSAGLVARGVRVSVGAPATVGRTYAFTSVGARFFALPGRRRPQGLAAVRAVCADADLVHAHGMRAGLLAALALGRRAAPLVVTWHTRSQARGIREALRRVTEWWVARTARVVLGTTSDLVRRARGRGARDARLAPVTLPAGRSSAGPGDPAPQKLRVELGAVGRPLLVAAGPFDAGRRHDALLTAARAWRQLEQPPLLVIAGDGPGRAAGQRRIEREELPIRLIGGGDEAVPLVAAADVAVLAARWEARPWLAREALSAGVPLVATAVGGVPELVGDAAVLVPYGDPGALAAAVSSLLADPGRRARLAQAGRDRAATWPTIDTTVAQVLALYDELAMGQGGGIGSRSHARTERIRWTPAR